MSATRGEMYRVRVKNSTNKTWHRGNSVDGFGLCSKISTKDKGLGLVKVISCVIFYVEIRRASVFELPNILYLVNVFGQLSDGKRPYG